MSNSFATPWTVACPGLKPSCSAWQADSVPLSQQGSPGVGTESCRKCESDIHTVAGVSGVLLSGILEFAPYLSYRQLGSLSVGLSVKIQFPQPPQC